MPNVGTVRWLPAFLFLAAIWGNSFLFIKVAVDVVHPLQLSLLRMAIGAATLLVVLAITRQRLPRDPRLWAHFAVVSVVATTLPFTLFGYGEQHVSSVLAAIWNATTPLCALLFTLLVHRSERPTPARMAGLGVGFLGVMIVLGVWRPMEGGALLGSLACFAAAVCYGVAAAYMSRFLAARPEPPIVLATGQLLAGTVQLAIITPLAGVSLLPPTVSTPVWASIVGLGALGTGIAYLLFYRVLSVAGVTTASTVTYLLPVFAAISGVLLLGEGITWNQPVGAAIVLIAIAITQGRISLPRRRSEPARATVA